jgi:hypothetical protein
MRTIKRVRGETLDTLAGRAYCVRGTDGHDDVERIREVVRAIRASNPESDDAIEVRLPPLAGIPFLAGVIDSVEMLLPEIHRVLGRVRADRRLLALSFVDPIRVGCEELGIAVTPSVAEEIRRRLAGHVSFNRERYTAIKRGQPLRGVMTIDWVHQQ